MEVLQLTTIRSSFFQDQIDSLSNEGINCDVIAASDWRQQKDWQSNSGRTIRETTWDKFEAKFAGFNPIYYSVAAARFYPLLLKQTVMEEYDIIHGNAGLTSPFATLQPERPLVITFWGTFLKGGRLAGYSDKVARVCSKRADAVIVRNEKMRNEIPGEAHVIPSGVDLEKFKPIDRKFARSDLGWDENEYYVVFVNNPDKQIKRVGLAKEVVEQVNREFDRNVNLKVVTGVAHDQVSTYLNAADALLLTSESEGSPNVVKEAMACNCPVVTTNVGDVEKRLSDVEPSEICSNRNELINGLSNILSKNERSNGRLHVEDVSKEKMGEKIKSIYEEVL